MTEQEFLTRLGKPVSLGQKIDTCNGWGFGGYVATPAHHKNNVIVTKGKFSYRHTGTSPYSKIAVKYNGQECEIITQGKGYSEKVDVYKYTYDEGQFYYSVFVHGLTPEPCDIKVEFVETLTIL